MSETAPVPENDINVQNAILRQELADLSTGRAMMQEELLETREKQQLAESERDTDALTGTASQRIYLQEVQRIIETGINAPVVFIDLDQLKRINDTLGHAVGDQAIRIVGLAAMNAVESIGLPRNRVTRAGGDEFVIFLRQGEEQRAQQIIDAMATAFAAVEKSTNLTDISYTAHAGTTLEAAEQEVQKQKDARPDSEKRD